MATEEQAILRRRIWENNTQSARPQGANIRSQPAAQSVPQRVQPPAANLSQAPVTSVPQRVQPSTPVQFQGGPAAASVPVRSGIGAPQVFPSQAEALRGSPGGSASVPQRASVAPSPLPVNTAPAGDATARVGQRLANISGQPYRDPRSVFNRPIDIKPAASAVKSGAVKAGAVAKAAGKAMVPSIGTLAKGAAVVGGITEASRAGYDMLTPGMTDLDKTARVAEGVGRFGLATGGAVKGAAMGSALGPAGTVVGGIAGGTIGAFAPELVNKAYNAVTGFFGGDGDNQLPSQKAAELREKNGMPPADQPAVAIKPTGVSDAGAGRGSINPPLAKPDLVTETPVSQPASRSAAKADKTAKTAPQAAVQGIGGGPNPMDGVLFTSLGDDHNAGRSVAKAYMADGRVIEGPEAIKIIQAADAYNAANPVQGGPVQIIRGGQMSTAVPELGFAEMATPDYEAIAANGGIGRLTEAVAQGAIDAQAPEAAKMRAALAERELANQGGAAQAAISAGPGFARVAEERRQFDQARADAERGIGRIDPKNFITVGGGQEPMYDNNGMFVGMRTVPGRLYNAAAQKWVDGENAQITSIDNDPRATAIRDDKKMTREQKIQALKALGYE